MKNIQLINPQQAADLLSQWDDSFIQVLTNDKPIVLAKPNSFKTEQVQGLQIEIEMGSAYKIDLASYPDDVILELRDLEWGVLLLINNTEHVLAASNYSLADLSPIAGLTNLSALNLRYCQLSDLSPLAGLRNISTLDLYGCKSLSDLSPLAGLTNLSTLDLSYCASLSDLSPLAGLTNLSTLNLDSCTSLSDLSPLAGLRNLSSLDLSS